MNVREVDVKQTKQAARKLLKEYPRLKRLEHPAVSEINKAVEMLDCRDREIIKRKFLNSDDSNVKIYASLFISESAFYRRLDKALVFFAEIYRKGELVAYKEEVSV